MRARRHVGMRCLALALALEAFWTIGAIAAPGDIFTVAAPAAGAAPPATTPVNAGDASVATKTGAFE